MRLVWTEKETCTRWNWQNIKETRSYWFRRPAFYVVMHGDDDVYRSTSTTLLMSTVRYTLCPALLVFVFLAIKAIGLLVDLTRNYDCDCFWWLNKLGFDDWRKWVALDRVRLRCWSCLASHVSPRNLQYSTPHCSFQKIHKLQKSETISPMTNDTLSSLYCSRLHYNRCTPQSI